MATTENPMQSIQEAEQEKLVNELLSGWDSPAERQQAKDALTALQSYDGWKILVTAIKNNIRDLTDELIHPSDDVRKLPKGDRIKLTDEITNKIVLQENFCVLPEALVKALSVTAQKTEVNDDPYL
jgi:hypothetical protein